MSEFNFNSQVCTSKEQSERLLALGLKKETADCYYWQENDHTYGEATGVWHLETLDTEDTQEHFEYLDKYFGVCLAADEEHYFIPAWSMHRMIEMMPKVIKLCYPNLHFTMLHDSVHYCDFDYDEEFEQVFSAKNNIYENIIDCYEWLIKNWYFDEALLNKE